MKKLFALSRVLLCHEIVNYSKDQEFAPGIPMYRVRYFIAHYLLPEVALQMLENNEDEIRKEDLIQMVNKQMAAPIPEWFWGILGLGEWKDMGPAVLFMSTEQIMDELIDQMKLLTEVEPDVFEFTGAEEHLEYFAGMGIQVRLIKAAKLYELAKAAKGEEKQELAQQAVDRLLFFENRKWSDEVLRGCGAAFKIPSSCPIGVEDEWRQDHHWLKEFDVVMDLFRRVPENPVMELILEKRKHGPRKAKYYSEQNLGTILRYGRMKNRQVDFTGIDFHGIDMTKMDLGETVFGRMCEGKWWAANLENTGIETFWG